MKRIGTVAAALVLVVILSSPFLALDGPTGEGLEGQGFRVQVGSPVPAWPVTRGGIVLLEGETLELTGSHLCSFLMLGNGSKLVLEGCDLAVTGDQFNDPFVAGNPSELVIRNSTIMITGMDSPGLYRTGGQNASFIVGAGKRFELASSTIDVRGGQGLGPVQEGSYFTCRVSGTMFKGGNATFAVTLPDSSGCNMAMSSIFVSGGDGGDAPKGQNVLLLGSERRPGGYTMGGAVCGEVGRGGAASLEIDGPAINMIVSDTDLLVRGGKGARAGDGGYIASQALTVCDVPIPAGGYSAGMYSQSTSLTPGTVSGNVGRGGGSSLELNAKSLDLSFSTFLSRGGDGGDAGCPGAGTYKAGTWTSYVRAGLGGGGYSGGASTPSGGQKGGNVCDKVGSGGDARLHIDLDKELKTTDWVYSCQGGNGGVATEGGLSGCVESGTYPRGGGGGGGGYSGGGGGGLESIGHSKQGGSSGYVGGRVGSGGDSTLLVRALYSSGRGDSTVSCMQGEAFPMDPLTGQDSISRATGEVLAYGGGGAIGNVLDGVCSQSVSWPAPFLTTPVENGFLRDISQPFVWEEGSSSLGGPLYYRFRLLDSMDTSDVIEESALVADESYYLSEDPGDGRYFWSVWIDGQLHDSVWARPREVVLDRDPPSIEAPVGRKWTNGTSPLLEVHAFDEVSGLGSGTVLYKVQKKGTVSVDWKEATVKDLTGGNHILASEVPMNPGDYEVYFRVSDRAGNGPVIGGPYLVSVDTIPPMITGISPTGWSDGEIRLSFDLMENGAGPVEGVNINAVGGNPWASCSFISPLLEGQGDRRSCSEVLQLTEGEWSLTLSVRDKVGNIGVSDPLGLRVDRTPPNVQGTSPCNGTWTNSSRPTFTFSALDTGSGTGSADVEVLGPEGHTVSRFAASLSKEGLWSARALEDLPDGRFFWRTILEDAVGNERSSPVTGFGVDTVPPVTSPPSEWRVVEGEVVMDLPIMEDTSGIFRAELQTMLWGPKGWVMGEVAAKEGPVVMKGGSVQVSMRSPTSPLVFLRARGIDMAGNIGPWSDVFRLEISPTFFSARSTGDEFITPDEGMEISIYDEIGIDIASLELTVRGTDGRAVHPEFGAEVEVRDLVPSSSAVQHPVSVLLSMSSAGVMGELALEVSWESVLPLGERRYQAFKGPVVDGDLPNLDVSVPDGAGSNPFLIRMKASDEASGLDLSSIEVEVGKGNRSGCNGPGEPRLDRGEGDGLVLHVNLTWGVATMVSITLSDHAGNEAYAEVIVRASRPPEVWITSDCPLEGGLRIGQEVQLKASVFDPDREALTFLWTVNGSAAGNGTVLDLVLLSSFVNVTVTVSDGCLSGTDSVVLTAFYPNGRVEAAFPILPVLIGSGAFLVIVIIAAAVSVMTLTSYRKARSKGEGVEDHGRDTKVRKDRPEKARKSKVYSGPGSSKGGGGEAECTICMKTFQARSDNPRCRCGALFHKACALRKGVCPDCGREIMLKAE